MKIAIAVERDDPNGGGAERSTRQIADELISRGHEVTLLAGSGACEGAAQGEKGVRVKVCPSGGPRGGLGLVRYSRWIDRVLHDGAFDVSLSVTTTAGADVLEPRSGIVREFQARNIARRGTALQRGIKRLALACSPKQRALRWAEARTIRSGRVRRYVAISDYVRRQMREHFDIPDERITLIHNAVVTPSWSAKERLKIRADVRRELTLSDTTTAYLFVSHNPALKGFGSLSAAFAALVRAGGDVTLVIAGCWSYRMEQQMQRLGVRENVRFVGKTSRVAELYCASDVCVLPSYFDPSSKVVLEALALDVPAITTRYNGASDLVTPLEGRPRGRVIDETQDVAALTQAMRELTDPEERARCREAMNGLTQSLSMRRHVDQLEAVLIEAAK